MKIKNKRQGCIHAQAVCQDCDWEEGWFLTARNKAYEHAKKTGHHVIVETGYIQHYNEPT